MSDNQTETISEAFEVFVASEIEKIKRTGILPDYITLGKFPQPICVGAVSATSSVIWIDASSHFPDDDMTVLLALDDGEVWTGFMDDGVWRYVSADAIEGTVKHWAEFPEPPNAKG